MRDAAGQVADRLHLLRLYERRLCAFPGRDFAKQAIIGLAQLRGAFGDAGFQRFIQLPQLPFRELALGDIDCNPGQNRLPVGVRNAAALDVEPMAVAIGP